MPNYRRAFVPGGCWFFTVNLLERRTTTLVDRIDALREAMETTRGRYDGSRGNPFDEPESGRFYARAMSSWGLLIAAQGLVLDGPAGILGFKPNWHPEDHRSFFTAPEGW